MHSSTLDEWETLSENKHVTVLGALKDGKHCTAKIAFTNGANDFNAGRIRAYAGLIALG
jgi:hypothetical protein